MVVMTGTNPIRGMYTSIYTDICSHYGSSNINPNPADFYQGTRWCNVGILMGNPMYSLEARFRGNAWEHRAKDTLTGLFIQLSQQGNASYGAFRTNDSVFIPGKHGEWSVQTQIDSAPYVLYMP
jgi:hypothetical protein